MYSAIRAKLVELIEQMDDSPIQCVTKVEKSTYPGYPAVSVSPSEEIGDYHETHSLSAKRRYMFNVRAYYPFVDGEETADLELEKVADALLDLFQDKKIIIPAADWIAPAPSVWGYQRKGNGEFRTVQIKLEIIKYY